MRIRRDSSSAFSLVEILMVLAIIAIVAAVLVPVVAAVKKSSKKITCLSNMHQIGLASQLYENDYDDLLPPVNPGKWFVPHLNVTVDPLRKYGLNDDIYHCPENRIPRITEKGTDYRMRFVLDLLQTDHFSQQWRIVPEEGSVIAYCPNHEDNPNHAIADGKGGSIQNETINILRHSGTLERVQTGKVKVHKEDWGRFGPTIQPWSYEWNEFPGEPFPPQLERLPPMYLG